MPAARKTTKTVKNNKDIEEDNSHLQNIDVQYNPDIVATLLKELKDHTDSKCSQIQRDAEFMITSMQQAFHLELIKLPSQVKNMSVKRFKEDFGCSLEAVTRGVIAGASMSHDRNSLIQKGLITPASKKVNYTNARNPREGEMIVSTNGSPLGTFTTVKKPLRPADNSFVPPTPGVFVPLKFGEVVDLESVDVDALSMEAKEETLLQMEQVMGNMRNLMEKLKGKAT
jgi:hypothetical protein